MVDVFISYKKERRAHARRLAAVLEAYGFHVWWDYGLLVEAGDYDAQIEAKLLAARAVIVLWCSGSRASTFVKDEARRAQAARKLLPALIEAGVEPPLGFGMAEMAFLLEWTGDPEAAGIMRLVEGLERLAGRPRERRPNMIDTLKESPPLPAVAVMAVSEAADSNAPPVRQPGPTSVAGPTLQDLRETWAALRAAANIERMRRFHDQHARGTLLAFEVEQHIETMEAEAEAREQARRVAAEAERRAAEAKAAQEAEQTRRRTPGAEFRDGEGLPLMVTLPPGRFLMGSPETEKDRRSGEGPQREVRIGYPLAVGKFPVLVGEWRKFVEATGHDTGKSAFVWNGKEWKDTPGKGWRDPGFAQDDRHPVTCVSWEDATAYAAWASQQSGQPCRLLSEAEWEYACRAGTTTRYAFGDEISTAQANFNSERNGTTPAGQYCANRFGLHDMHGNVREWCADCHRDTLEGQPQNAEAFETASCSDRVIRGGSWSSGPQNLRSAGRSRYAPSNRCDILGFRLARTLF